MALPLFAGFMQVRAGGFVEVTDQIDIPEVEHRSVVIHTDKYLWQAGKKYFPKQYCPQEIRISNGGGGGNRTRVRLKNDQNISTTESKQNDANPIYGKSLGDESTSSAKQIATQPKQNNDTSLHEKYAVFMHQNHIEFTTELEKLLMSWGSLPDAIKAGIIAMVKAAMKQELK